LSGRPLFDGDTVSDLIAKILQTEPDWSALPAQTPARVRTLLARCLTKDPKQRLRDIGEARITLADTAPDAPTPPGGSAARGNNRWPMWAALVIVASLIVGFAARFLSHAPAAVPVALSIMLPKGTRLDGGVENGLLAITPDGTGVAFTASIGAVSHGLFVRRFDKPELTELAGTDGSACPFFSPDGEWVAFFAGGHLLKTSLHGGTPVELAEAGSSRGGTWLDNGSIVYAPTFASALRMIDANGGAARAITVLDSTRSERTHRWPCGLPGSKWVVFTVGVTNSPGGYDDANIEAVSLQSGERRVLAHGSCAHYAQGDLVFARNGSLYAMPLDPADPRAAASAVPVLDGVLGAKTSGAAFFDIAGNGTLVTIPGREASSDARLVWRDMDGHGTPVPGEPRSYLFFDISPDGKSALANIGSGGGNGDVFLLDLKRGTLNQLTFDGHDVTPIWTPDGRRMVWASSKGSTNEVVIRSVLGGDSVRVLATASFPLLCTGVRHDGSAVMFSEYGTVDSDISEVPLAGGAARVLVHEPHSQSRGVTSPDDHWIAYVSDETGTRQVCVKPVAGSGGRTQVSTSGGIAPMWAPDGHTLYFASQNGLAAVTLTFRDDAVVADSTRYLFDLPFIAGDGSVQAVGLDPSGKRFLVRTPVGEVNELREISVRTNWAATLASSTGKGAR
jgi:serine/threonine-protein kinase